ncbi:c2H2-type domain-containing protein [Trichonephila clavipes]|nr:c2H2-type domain-containing protein [Trichonephila clavipes]
MQDFEFLFEHKEFSNFSEFEIWKKFRKGATQVHFVKHFEGRKVRSGKVIYFNCFRSGNTVPDQRNSSQDIKNVKRSFGLTNQRHVDDATSVRLMLEEMAEFSTDNPILGCLSSEYEGLNNEDFFLALQHPLQREKVKKFGEEIVCVDSTHGTNSYNFKNNNCASGE